MFSKVIKLYNCPKVPTHLGFENIKEIEREVKIILCNSFLTSRQILSFKNYFSDQDIKMNTFLVHSKHATPIII